MDEGPNSLQSASQADFWLASVSPRRRELLQQLGYRFVLLRVDVDESPLAGEEAAALALRLAVCKAGEGARRVAATSPLPVLGADTVVAVDGRVLGKPATRDEALQMLGLLSGRTHSVLTAVALVVGGRTSTVCSETRVSFRTLTAAEMLRYWDSGEPRDKAGGYAIQGFGAVFVQRIEGSYSGVVGLPLFETARLLQDAGIDGWQRGWPHNE